MTIENEELTIEPSMEDTIASSWKEISQDLQEPNTTIVRDGTGKFTKREEATDADVKSEVAKEPKEAKEPIAKLPLEPVEDLTPKEPIAETSKAPSSWKKEAQEKFATLPPEIQAEVLRREGDFHKGTEGYKQAAETGRKYEQIVAPYRQTMESLGVTPDVAINELLRVDSVLRNAPPAVKVQEILRIAQVYGADLTQQFNPDVAELQRKNFDMEQRLKTLAHSDEQRANEALTSEIVMFSQGKEHFADVQDEMVALLPMFRAQNPQSSNQEVLQMAYDRAIYANPKSREAIQSKQAEELRLAAQRKATEARKSASVNVPSRGTLPSAGPARTPWDDADIKADAQRLGLIN